jgi:hypothetical protein
LRQEAALCVNWNESQVDKKQRATRRTSRQVALLSYLSVIGPIEMAVRKFNLQFAICDSVPRRFGHLPFAIT